MVLFTNHQKNNHSPIILTISFSETFFALFCFGSRKGLILSGDIAFFKYGFELKSWRNTRFLRIRCIIQVQMDEISASPPGFPVSLFFCAGSIDREEYKKRARMCYPNPYKVGDAGLEPVTSAV